jgi:uncharacterized protein with predicted RNA binding PUA domain
MDARERERERRRLRTLADYQFGRGAGRALFGREGGDEDEEGDVVVRRTSTGRPQQVLAGGDRLVSYGTDGRFTLGVAGGRRLRAALDPPAYRVVVGDESEPFVRDGANAFAKFVAGVDASIRPGDEVLVVHERGDLLAVGRAELPGPAMRDFGTGMAVKTREGAGSPDGSA